MNFFRKNVLVLFGAALLIAMSVGSALGAKPTGSDTTRGQTISDFVHSVISGDEAVTADENTGDEAPADEAPAEEDTTETEGTTDSTPADTTAGTDANAHGKCVAAIAGDHTLTGGDNDNHGGAVSLAARDTCWEPAAPAGSEDTTADVQAEMTAREKAAAERAAAKEARKADKALAKDARSADKATAVHGKSADHLGSHGRP